MENWGVGKEVWEIRQRLLFWPRKGDRSSTDRRNFFTQSKLVEALKNEEILDLVWLEIIH